MSHEPTFTLRRIDAAWLVVSLLLLLPCLFYPYRSLVPQLGFLLAADWTVRSADPCASGEDCLEVGDRVLAIGEVSHEEFFASRNSDPFRPFRGSEPVAVKVLRHGQPLELALRRDSRLTDLVRLDVLILLFPLVFWLMGTAVILFLRPRDERWLVLMLFHYVSALWLASGLASFRQTAGAGVVFHLVIWFFLPLVVHLHLILPSPLLGRWRNRLLVPLYLASLVLALLDTFQRLDAMRWLFAFWFMFGLVVALGLLVSRLLLPASNAERVATRIMMFGVVVGFGPWILFFVTPSLLPNFLAGRPDLTSIWRLSLAILLVAIPILPLSYFYAIYKHHLGALSFRANRLLGTYGFFSLYLAFFGVTQFLALQRWSPGDNRSLPAAIAVSLVFMMAAPFLRSRFQTVVDRHIFSIRHTPEEVVSLVASKIPSAFNRATLTRVIVEEILPTLLVRQSALCLFVDGDRKVVYELGLEGSEAAPSKSDLGHLLRRAGRYLPPEAASPAQAWIRLAIPLGLHAEAIGLWLLGRRDPDDHYPASDIKLLTTVANQVAAMLENILLYERAQDEIAQRRAADEENRQLQGQLLHSQKMEAIGRLSAGVAHDFNNCLLAIFGFSDFLLARPTDDPLVTRSLKGIREAGQKAANLTKQLLAFTRQQPMEPRVVSLNGVISGMEPMVRGVLGSKVELVSRLASDLPEVRIDPVQIEQVILNLAVNAKDAMPKGGRLHIETRAVELVAGAMPAPDLTPGSYALLVVSDSGLGMDATTQARAFEPFYSTKKLDEGTGLGLSTAYGIVRQSGGHISVVSALGQGAAFSIYLPAAATAEMAANPESRG